MNSFELYTFFLCLIVFILLTTLFIVMLAYIVVLTLKQIRHGLDDEQIKKEYKKEESKSGKKLDALSRILSYALSILLVGLFISSVVINVNSDNVPGNVPTLKLVQSGSMSKKHSSNTYLEKYGLNEQFQTHDLIYVYKMPEEKDLKLYDVVCYKTDMGHIVIHRIVSIEEANNIHPNEKWYITKGDANRYIDSEPVTYSQMTGIYTGKRIQHIGSFVAFMSSPAGAICALLIIFYIFATPIVERKIVKEKMKRLLVDGTLTHDDIAKIVDANEAIQLPLRDAFEDKRPFKEKFNDAPIEVKDRYWDIMQTIYRVEGIEKQTSEGFDTFVANNIVLSKFTIRHKQLNTYLGLGPREYSEYRYTYVDHKGNRRNINFPVRVKVNNEERTLWVKNLILQLADKNNLQINEKPKMDIKYEDLLSFKDKSYLAELDFDVIDFINKEI